MAEELKTKEACEQAGGTWDPNDQKCIMPSNNPTGDKDLIRENEMLKAELTLRKDQLKQAISIANRANEQAQARDEAERQNIISRIVIDSNNKFKPEELKDKSLSELRLMQTVIDKSLDQTFASIAAYQADEQRRKKPLLTAGAWDSAKKQWVGGA